MGLLKTLRSKPGEHRSEINQMLSGKPGDLPQADSVYDEEEAWVQQNDPRVVHFGEYQMVVLRVPPELDAGEIGRRSRLATGARLSLASREDDDLVILGCNEEKRHINVSGLVEHVVGAMHWVEESPGGDRAGRVRVDELPLHPERLEALVGEIVRNRSILYG
jgi:hypothetical protein